MYMQTGLFSKRPVALYTHEGACLREVIRNAFGEEARPVRAMRYDGLSGTSYSIHNTGDNLKVSKSMGDYIFEIENPVEQRKQSTIQKILVLIGKRL